MIPLETILRIIDDKRNEVIEAAEYPAEGQQTEFGFGRVKGMFQALRHVRDAVIEAANQQTTAEQETTSFEGDEDNS